MNSLKIASILLLLAILAACSASPTAASTALPSAAPTLSQPTAIPPSPTPQPTSTPSSSLSAGTNGFPWWNDTVFYEIFVRSFYDSNGDGQGDFQGLTAKLDYLKDLGISGIWLMPINTSSSFYDGYAVTDYYGVNSEYGTMDQFKTFLNEAHKRNIRVVIDFVLNHTSNEHAWFQASLDPTSKYRGWYIWSDTNPGYPGPWGEDVWHAGAGGGYYYGIFQARQPDLNYKNPAVTQEMEKVTQFWLQDVGIDGFRLDGAQYLIEDGKTQANTPATHDWYKQYRTFYKGVNPQAMTVGEITATSYAVAAYVKGDQLDLAFDFDQAKSWVNGVNGGDAGQLMNSTNFEHSIFPTDQVATFLTNHDQDRVMSQLGDNVNKAKAAATILLTSPGVPFIYYGEEIGMDGKGQDEAKRTPMQWTSDSMAGFTTGEPWEPINIDFKDKNVASQSKDPNSLLAHYKALIALRNQHPALRIGEVIKVDTASGSVYAILRTSDQESQLVLINLSDQPVSDYNISFNGSKLKGAYQVKALLGTGNFSDLTVDDSGAASGYLPISSLPAYANLVLNVSQK